MTECLAIGGPREGEVIDLGPDEHYFRHPVYIGQMEYEIHEYKRFTWMTAEGRVFYVLADHNPSGYAGELTIKRVAKELDKIAPICPTRPLRVTIGLMNLHRDFLCNIVPLIDAESRRRRTR